MWHLIPSLSIVWVHLSFLFALSGLSLFVRLMQPLRWGALNALQPIIVLTGILVPLLVVKDEQLAIWTGWCLLLFFHVPAIYVSRALTDAMYDLDASAIETWANIEPWLIWGKSGKFRHDLHMAYAAYLLEKPAEAEKYLEPWLKEKDIPPMFKPWPLKYKIDGEAILWNWEKVSSLYDELAKDDEVFSRSLGLLIARMKLEFGEVKEAADKLREAHFEESIFPLSSIATSVLPFFSLTGARTEFYKLVKVLEATKARLAPGLISLWSARCELACGDRTRAQSLLEDCSKSKVHLIQSRASRLMTPLLAGAELERKIDPKDPSVLKEVSSVWQLFKRAAFIQEILSPRRQSICVNVICITSIMMFVVSVSFLLPLGIPVESPISPLSMGVDFESVVKREQYYRLITYLFYHSDVLHIGSNLIGLYVFGRIAENIFGSSRFLAIYFVGGILSGVFHLFLSDKIAVGASGAIQAVFAACAVGIYKIKILPRNLKLRYLSFMTGLTLFQMVLDHVIPFIAVFAHLGGLLSGFLMGSLISVRDPASLASLEGEVDGTQTFI